MRNLAIILCLTLALVGCQTLPGKDVIVNNDKVVAVVPKPPAVPTFDSQVDKLTDADVKDPGKVGVAYKYDMTALRGLILIYRQIIDQYSSSSVNFDAVNTQINQLYTAPNPAVKPPAAAASAAK